MTSLHIPQHFGRSPSCIQALWMWCLLQYTPWLSGRRAPAFLLNQPLISDRILNLVFLVCIPVALTDVLELFLLAPLVYCDSCKPLVWGLPEACKTLCHDHLINPIHATTQILHFWWSFNRDGGGGCISEILNFIFPPNQCQTKFEKAFFF